ncbi:hypothetical protein GCM10007047_02370 [Cerasicoccus arenae]|uniref:CBM6 domain-containing protein n=2 Tax=Cerasicoccus arenae TaxID=424488 RepID=A0A8J3GCU5_9BACT|nr:hypothetical protein GCM10007047_02370 [Cerasicoccus arenae]
MSTTLNTTMVPGDTLYVGSGNYVDTQIFINSDGTASLPKTIKGVDTGGGIPHFNGDPGWTRTSPNSGQSQVLLVRGDHWIVQNLEISRTRHGIKNSSGNSSVGLTFRDILIHDVRHGVYLYYVDDTLFENVVVQEYTKQGFRLDRGCDNVTFRRCTADMTGGDVSWWDHGESLPFGFVGYGSGTANTNLVFEDCIAMNNRWNNQTDSNGDPQGYYNGDGFVLEGSTGGTSQFIRCIAVNNEDAGFDIKPVANFEGCVSVKNYRGFRLWHNTKTLNNCVAAYPFRRTTANQTGSESTNGSGIWTQNGHSTVTNYTYYGNTGRGLDEDGSGSLTVTDSIIAFSGAAGSYETGSVTLGSGTVTYRPGSGTDPDFFGPSITWNGIGNELDSQEYGQSIGYHSLSTPFEAESLLVSNSGEGETLVADVSSSGGELVRLDADSTGDWIEFSVPNLPVGTYWIFVTDKTASDRGIYQLSVDGVDIGAPVDQYSSTAGYGEVAIGTVTLASDATAVFRFTVTGKNGSSSGYTLAIDSIRLALNAGIPSGETEFFEIIPEADTFVNDGNATTNFGSDTRLLAKSGPSEYKRIAYLRFALPSTTNSFLGATLKLNVESIGGEGSGARYIEIRQLANDSWDESTMTWNTRESSTGTLIATIDARTPGVIHEIDVSAYVSSEMSGDGSASFVLIQPGSGNKLVIFGSRENTGKEPVLEIETEAPSSTISEIDAEADAYVHDANPTTNYGSNLGLAVKNGSPDYDRISYVRFPLSSLTGTVTNATLKLRVNSIGGEGSGARYIEIRQLVNDAWDESTMTWNTREPSSGTLIATIDARTPGVVHEIDVTSYIAQEAIDDGGASFVLIQPSSTPMYVTFNSREDTGKGPVLEVESTTAPSSVLVFDSGSFSDYASQSASGGMTLGAGNTSLQLTGNYWRKYAYSYTVTADTMMEVTLDASDVGELTCIGFDSDNDYLTGLTHIKLAGSQVLNDSFAPISPLYVAGSGPVTLVIPVGSFFTGSMSYLTFVGDDDDDASLNAIFSDIRIYEAE